MKILRKKCWDSFVILSFGIPDEPPCYVRECSASSNSLYEIAIGASSVNMISDMSYMSRGKFTAYVCVCRGTAIHNSSSSGSLLFATLRWNN